MDKENNDVENLYLFDKRSKHGCCHGSLNKLVKTLLNKNLVEFDRNKGIYKISK